MQLELQAELDRETGLELMNNMASMICDAPGGGKTGGAAGCVDLDAESEHKGPAKLPKTPKESKEPSKREKPPAKHDSLFKLKALVYDIEL